MSPNKEDYLKCIYEISQTTNVTNKKVAQAMNVSAPAASEMIKKLLHEQQIKKDKTGGYVPTEIGMTIISNIVRKHRLIEVFLIESLHYPTDSVHQEAEILEHVVSDLFIDRLDYFLKFPQTCPHGGTIPKKEELLQETYTRPLTQVTPGTYTIGRTLDQPELLRYLEQISLHVGDTIEVTHNDEYAQLLSIIHQDQPTPLSYIIAQQIYIKP